MATRVPPMRAAAPFVALALALAGCAAAEPELRGTAADPSDVAPPPAPAATALRRGFDPATLLGPASAGGDAHDHHHHHHDAAPPASTAAPNAPSSASPPPPASASAAPKPTSAPDHSHHPPGAPR